MVNEDIAELKQWAEEDARAHNKRRPEEQREVRRALRREWFQKNREHAYAYAKSYKVRRSEAKAARSKPTVCEACEREHDKIVFDHDHTTGMFRGWICDTCNVVLGRYRDDPVLLDKLAAYLRKDRTNDT